MHGQNVDDLVKYQMDTFGYSEDVAREEVVANSAATVLTDEEFVRNLYNNEHSLFEKIRKFFSELADTFKQLTQSASWSQNAALTPENVRAIAEVFDRVAADTKTPSTGIEFEPMTRYSAKDRNIIEGYLGAVDTDLLEIARWYKSNKQAKNARHKVTSVSDRMASDIKLHVGIDVKGYEVWVDKSTFGHIEKRHGENGSADHSMADLNDVARMKYVIDHYDDMEVLVDKDGKWITSSRYTDSMNNQAPLVIVKKKINGTYFLSEAVVDSKWHKVWVETAYINKKGVTQVETMPGKNRTPASTSETHPASPPKSTIAEASEVVKFSAKDPVEKKGTLLAIHNLTEEKLQKFLALGGAPMPSIAVTRSDVEHSNFGDISLIFDKSTIDPKASRKNTVYSADAWTPTFPQIEYETNTKVDNAVYSRLTALSRNMDKFYREDLKRVLYGVDEGLNRYGGEAGFVEHAMDNLGLQTAT